MCSRTPDRITCPGNNPQYLDSRPSPSEPAHPHVNIYMSKRAHSRRPVSGNPHAHGFDPISPNNPTSQVLANDNLPQSPLLKNSWLTKHTQPHHIHPYHNHNSHILFRIYLP